MKKEETTTVTLRPETYENLQHYATILKLPPEMIVEQALDAFFAEVHRQLGEKNPLDDSAQTNLSYDEFWDGVEL
jgi:predicted transcriptional regulator